MPSQAGNFAHRLATHPNDPDPNRPGHARRVVGGVVAGLEAEPMIYKIAHTMESGEWDVLESFAAENENEANAYAEQNYAGDDDWYVLDERGKNINN